MLQVSHLRLSKEKIETPVNEYNIPDTRETIKAVLGTAATTEAWAGYFDVHHAAWPKRIVTQYDTTEVPVGHQFRNTAPLLVRLPRQLHNYLHVVTEQPPMPDRDVMEQWLSEYNQIKELCSALTKRIRARGRVMTPEYHELLQRSRMQRAIDQMQDGELGLLPDREMLYSLSLQESRELLLPIIQIPTVDRNGMFLSHEGRAVEYAAS